MSTDVIGVIDALDADARDAVVTRLRQAVSVLSGADPAPVDELVEHVERLLADADPSFVWLVRSVLGATLPDAEEMASLLRTVRLWGPWAALLPVVEKVGEADGDLATVTIVEGGVTCDIHDTASHGFLSGIQRVVRNVVVRWREHHDVEFVGWDDEQHGLRRLGHADLVHVFGGEDLMDDSTSGPTEIVVPWRGTHLVPELAGEPNRSSRLLALAKYSGVEVGLIGFDCIPMTTPESVAPGMVSYFATYLAACREATRIAAISRASAEEYAGWRQMLAGVGEDGPDIAAVPLPVVAQKASSADHSRASLRLGRTALPMVLVVGSHEPRKNHLAILHAAETLWREGRRFTLAIVGAGAWRSDEYYATIEELRSLGRPVESIRGLPDELLWAAYELAHVTLFPSLNEGFGLPVAESLAAGTPVITSDLGSMRDIVAPDGVPLGGLLIDPRDDHAITDALRATLTEPATYARLRAEAAQHDLGDWDTYAAQVWDFLVAGTRPAAMEPR